MYPSYYASMRTAFAGMTPLSFGKHRCALSGSDLEAVPSLPELVLCTTGFVPAMPGTTPCTMRTGQNPHAKNLVQ